VSGLQLLGSNMKIGAAGEAGKVLAADDPTTGALAEVQIVNLGTDWSAGDLLGARVTTPPAAHKLDLRDGTAAAPVKIGVSASYSRTDATTRAELNAMGPEGTDGPDGATVIRSAIKGTPASQVQIVAGMFTAWQTGAYEGVGADACPIYAFARTTGGATGRAIPAYFESSRETATSGGQQALELRVKNSSGASDSYVAGSASKSMGVWICASSAGEADSAAAIQVGHNFSRSFDVGLGLNELAIKSAGFRDDSSSLRSVFIRGAHEKGAIVVNKGAGQVIIGREEPQQATPLFEVFSETALDPIVSFGSNTGLSQRAQLIRNASGNMGAFVSNVANAFLTGTAQGDVGLTFTAGKILHLGAATKSSVLRVTEAGVGLGIATPSLGGGKGVVFVANAETIPSTNPSGGGILFAEGGVLKYRGSSGTVTTIAAA